MVDDIKPILFEKTEQEFKTQGIGVLSDVTECLVTEERNGQFEVEMQYPENGIHFSELQNDRILFVKPSPYKLPQPFRIYRITKPFGGIVSVYARHITYDLNGIPIDPFTAGNAPEAMDGLRQNSAIAHPFTFWTDKTTTGTFKNELPATVRSVLGGKAGSILDIYGGEYEWDKFSVKLHDKRGQDNGVVIRYGKNLTNIEQDENISNLYTGIYPFWKDSENNLVTAIPKIINAEGNFPFSKIVPVDFSSDFEKKPTSQQLTEKAREYLKANKVGVPTVSVKVEFVQLEQTEEYKDLSLLERCDLCDIVTVQFPKLGIDVKAKVVKGIYNALADRWESLEIGEAKTNITDTIIQQGNDIAHKIPGMGEIQGIVDKITGEILGAKGGAVRILDNDGDGVLDTLYIADNQDPKLAKKVWRFNYEGWGASKNGYNGPFTMAASIDTGFYADFITAGKLNASLITTGILNAAIIKAGILKAKSGNSYWNLDTGTLFLDGTLQTSSSDSKAIMKGGRIFLENSNTEVGYIGTNKWEGRTEVGLVFDLLPSGDYITWAAKRSNNDPIYYTKMTYSSRGKLGTDQLVLGCPLDCNFWGLKNLKSINGKTTATGKIPIVTDVEVTQSPYIQWWESEITVENGIIVGIPKPRKKVGTFNDLPKTRKLGENLYIERGDINEESKEEEIINKNNMGEV